ncbi:RNA polymerase sigma-70 factor [Chitinophaga nivalis]|uniref:RNA polymerase sigma-70 factor n=1 Tax=Chitinophaga nivalis TaxID=2991709 RepID=A0ABT3IN16_9BACT|nr:RNA polymerase sigma-70 factor [Chitinophaga nivalis]MCW3464953.1 RNA polymerase sigma-70 factor [Chitinophaga nivalis]MCW3485355.1 RNA polymerase sigma-70 factor [Chitinophaga nivalis]
MHQSDSKPANHEQQAQQSRPHFDAIYELYWKELYEAACRRLPAPADAEDILQEVFISLLKNPAVITSEGSIRAYLHKALKGRIIDFYRKSLLKETFERNALFTSPRAITHPDAHLMHKELEVLLEKEISSMPERMQTVFLMSRKQQLSNEEIAHELAISHQTVRNQISAAIKRIRRTLHQYNLANSASTTVILTVAAVLLTRH